MPRAMQAVKSAINMDPEFVFAYDCRGRYLRAQGKSESALRDLEHALALEPENARILFGVATVYYRLEPTGSLPGNAGSWTQH